MDEIQTTVLTSVIGAGLGLLPVLITGIAYVLERRSLYNRVKRELELSQMRVEFLNTWVSTQQLVCDKKEFDDLKQQVANELKALHQTRLAGDTEITRVLAQIETKDTGVKKRSLLQLPFLTYWPPTISAWVFHLFFYMAIGIDVMLVFQKLKWMQLSVPGQVSSLTQLFDKLKQQFPSDIEKIQQILPKEANQMTEHDYLANWWFIGAFVAAQIVFLWLPARWIDYRARQKKAS